MASKVDTKELLRRLTGDEGPPILLFMEFWTKYGLPIGDGKIPFPTELNVMMQDWHVLLLDPKKAGFPGAIGFKKHQESMSYFALWPRAPYGAEQGYFHVGDSFPFIEVFSGESWVSIHITANMISTKIRFSGNGTELHGDDEDKAFFSVLSEVISRAVEISAKFGPPVRE